MSCLSVEELVDWFAGDLAPAESERVELHLFSCGDCSADATALAPLLTALRDHIPYIVSSAGLQALERRHVPLAHNEVSSGKHVLVPFPDGSDLLIIKLLAPLAGVARVDCELRGPDGLPWFSLTEVPFDADSVQLACQRHFLAPGEFKVTLRADDQAVAEYWISHF